MQIYFYILGIYGYKEKEKNTVGSLNDNQKCRLYSLVDESITSEIQKRPSEFGARMEIESPSWKECEDEVVVTFKRLDENSTAHLPKPFPVTPLPCFTSYYEKATVQFLVTDDPSDEHSVFILERIKDKDGTDEHVLVIGYTSKIPLLKHAKKFF